jgi:hypothetical protein
VTFPNPFLSTGLQPAGSGGSSVSIPYLIGYTQSVNANTAAAPRNPVLQVFATAQTVPPVGFYQYSNDTVAAAASFVKSRGALGAHAVVVSGDQLGNLAFRGSDGTDFITAAAIVAEVDGVPGSADMPGRIRALTTRDGAASATEALRLDSLQRMTTTAARIKKTRVVTAAGDVTVTEADSHVFVNKTVGAATVVNLPASPATGTEAVIKDAKGDALVNNITITPAAGTIDGAATLPIITNYGAARLVYNGTEWSVV